jgi:hypothetical protein
MSHQHKELAAGRWNMLSFAEQMANIGSEIERTIKWRGKGRPDMSGRAFERALELIDLTISILTISISPPRRAGSATLAPF